MTDGCSGCCSKDSCHLDAGHIARLVLTHEVKSSLGCTELGAIALAAAHARSHALGTVNRVNAVASNEVFLNGSSAGIPGTGGRTGIALALALGVTGGDQTKGMEVLEGVTPMNILDADEMVQNGIASCQPINRDDIFVDVKIETGEGECRTIIQGNHSTIKYCSSCMNSVGRLEDVLESQKPALPKYHEQLRQMTFQDLILSVAGLPKDCAKFIQAGIRQNREAASHPLNEGLARFDLGKMADRQDEDGIVSGLVAKISRVTTSASAHRMMGGVCPIMSSGGSGNQGVVAIVVPSMIGEYVGADQYRIQQGVYLSHLVNAKIKAHMGLTSAQCGCGVAAGVGAAVGSVYSMGGDYSQMLVAFNYAISALAGMVCDGANLGCAAKVDASTFVAVRAAFAAMHNTVSLDLVGGIVAKDPIDTIENLARVSKDMKHFKESIIHGNGAK